MRHGLSPSKLMGSIALCSQVVVDDRIPCYERLGLDLGFRLRMRVRVRLWVQARARIRVRIGADQSAHCLTLI